MKYTGFNAKKRYGQHFLSNAAIPARIADMSGITDKHGVIEIGAGQGALTAELIKKAKKVIAIEIDSDIIPILNENLGNADNLTIINRDILQMEIPALIESELSGLPVCVCANLPYYITTPIMRKLLKNGKYFEKITVMLQKEAANRFLAKAKTEDYCLASVMTAYYARAERLFTVSAGSFSPPPKVDSAVLKLNVYKKPPIFLYDEELFFKVTKAAFSHRRKTLINSLHSFLLSNFTKLELCDIISSMDLNANIRGEELNLSDFADLTNRIYKKLHKNGGKQ